MPHLTVYRAARVEALAQRLAGNLAQTLDDSVAVTRPVRIAVGNKGMERWLRAELARLLGVAMNLEFPFPRQAVLSLLSVDAREDAQWQRDAMTWRILTVLAPLLDSQAEMEPLRRWLARESGNAADVGRDRLALAGEIASVLDRAAIYRPQLLRAWSDPTHVDDGTGGWQRLVWRALCAQVEVLHPSLRLEDAAPQTTAHDLHVFAVSSLPPQWLGALKAASRCHAIWVYSLTPSDGYWGDYRLARSARNEAAMHSLQSGLREQHPLLTALGRLARDQLVMTVDLEPDADDAATPAAFAFAEGDHALHVLQRDIVALRSLDALTDLRAGRPLRQEDRSLQFHACHGPARQVEALREAIFALLRHDPTLRPRDIVVMTPDLPSYAPLVKAVFAEGPSQPAWDDQGQRSWGDFGGPALPTSIADLGLRQLNPLADVVLRLLEMAGGRLVASSLAEWTGCPAVMRRFALSDADVARVRLWLRQAGARLGADEDDRATMNLPRERAYTLAFALDRLALGVAMADDGGAAFCGIAPWDAMDRDAIATYGKFAELSAQVLLWRERLREPRTVSSWAADLLAAADACATVAPSAAHLRAELAEGLQQMADEAASFGGTVSVDAIGTWLTQRFAQGRGGDRPTTGAVTVCALTPMRSVPFRVVCLLGMDDGAFPRMATQRRFDLVAAAPQLGDLDPREEDRNLLLEAILSARDHLLVFYTGRDVKTDKELAPAVPIGDLLDSVDATFASEVQAANDGSGATVTWLPRQLLTTHHAIQPFSPSGFAAAAAACPLPRAERFDRRMWLVADALRRDRTADAAFLDLDRELPDTPPGALALDELVQWLCQPMQELVRKRMGVRLAAREDEAQLDREPLEANPLDRWQAGQNLAAQWRQDPRDVDTQRQQLLARGLIPPGTPGLSVMQTMAEQLAACAREAGATAAIHRQRVALDVDGTLLTADVSLHDGEVLYLGLDDPNKVRHILGAWVTLLAVRATDPLAVRQARIIGIQRGKVTSVTLAAPPAAMACLRDLVDLWRMARRRPLLLFAETSRAWAEAIGLTDPPEPGKRATARQQASAKWGGDEDAERGEALLHEIALVMADRKPWSVSVADGEAFSFAQLAVRLWRPIVAARQADNAQEEA